MCATIYQAISVSHAKSIYRHLSHVKANIEIFMNQLCVKNHVCDDLSSDKYFRMLSRYIEICHTSNEILRFSWINYVLDKCYRWFIKRDRVSYFNACSEKCHTSKLILTISWINYVLDQCHRWFIKRDQVSYFNACSETCHTSTLILRISWINYVLEMKNRLRSRTRISLM